ncbi:MAG: ADP-ribosylglycohydrolase family protein [Armatimonadetes bacterium]|nr:ADP-ribosylglycohydrolase family protein [Armatimonadota bacterium]
MPGWTDMRTLIKEEIIQRSEEGCEVAGFEQRWESSSTESDLMQLYWDLRKLRTKADFPYVEPSHLAGILAVRPDQSKKWDVKIDDSLRDRIHGAWLGRIAGCMLGKPVEGWSRDLIRQYLESAGEYPLSNYVPAPASDTPDELKQHIRGYSARGQFDHALADDDTNYTVMGLKIMEEKGPGFSTADVGHMWLSNLPYHHVCTAEKQAYLNLVNTLPIEDVPMYLNPYREWIGAQIRADFWGYCAPGDPQKAAEFAWRDASLSHVKNGIYGEMMCAAMISAALVCDDVYEIVKAGAGQIPAKCRLAETVADCLRWREECEDWEEAFEKMLATYYGKYNWVHTNNNLAIVLIAMLYGWPDYEKVACISVMQGMDTDCNGATAGSIIGAALGAGRLPEKWIDPLGGRLDTGVQGFMQPQISDLADRTMAQIKRVADS